MIRVYAPPGSGYSRRVLIALIEKGIAYQRLPIALRQGEHKQQAFLAMNPLGRVPVLLEDDFVLYESTAILSYLEAIHPTPPLQPPSARDRALMEMHIKLCDLQFARHTSTISVPKRFMPVEQWPLEAMAAARAELRRQLDIVEQGLEGKTFLVAEQFTLADLCYAPYLDLLPLLEIEPPARVATWAARVLSRPSVQASAAAD
jgi:glutathione S-transferase